MSPTDTWRPASAAVPAKAELPTNPVNSTPFIVCFVTLVALPSVLLPAPRATDPSLVALADTPNADEATPVALVCVPNAVDSAPEDMACTPIATDAAPLDAVFGYWLAVLTRSLSEYFLKMVLTSPPLRAAAVVPFTLVLEAVSKSSPPIAIDELPADTTLAPIAMDWSPLAVVNCPPAAPPIAID